MLTLCRCAQRAQQRLTQWGRPFACSQFVHQCAAEFCTCSCTLGSQLCCCNASQLWRTPRSRFVAALGGGPRAEHSCACRVARCGGGSRFARQQLYELRVGRARPVSRTQPTHAHARRAQRVRCATRKAGHIELCGVHATHRLQLLLAVGSRLLGVGDGAPQLAQLHFSHVRQQASKRASVRELAKSFW